jgi:hypothetical protein
LYMEKPKEFTFAQKQPIGMSSATSEDITRT